jgi:hypothetical protein
VEFYVTPENVALLIGTNLLYSEEVEMHYRKNGCFLVLNGHRKRRQGKPTICSSMSTKHDKDNNPNDEGNEDAGGGGGGTDTGTAPKQYNVGVELVGLNEDEQEEYERLQLQAEEGDEALTDAEKRALTELGIRATIIAREHQMKKMHRDIQDLHDIQDRVDTLEVTTYKLEKGLTIAIKEVEENVIEIKDTMSRHTQVLNRLEKMILSNEDEASKRRNQTTKTKKPKVEGMTNDHENVASGVGANSAVDGEDSDSHLEILRDDCNDENSQVVKWPIDATIAGNRGKHITAY